MVAGVVAVLGGLAQINPVWLYGPYRPENVSAGTQPDWYIGWLDGALRLMPPIEFSAFGYTFPFMIFFPSVVIPGILFTGLALWPFIEQKWITKDKAYHNLLDRPRDNPQRTALGVMALTFYTLLWIGGGNDLIATEFSLSINAISRALQVLLIVLPPITYWATKRICLGLQRSDEDKLHHGVETGVIQRLPSGEVIEVHAPLLHSPGLILDRSGHDPRELAGNVEHGDTEHLGTGSAEAPRRGVVSSAARALGGFFGKPAEPTGAEASRAEQDAAAAREREEAGQQ